MQKTIRSIAFLMCALSAVACSDHQPAPPLGQALAYTQTAAQPAPAPIVVQQAPQSGMQDMVVGAAIGALATHALAGPGGRQTAQAPAPVVHQTTVVQKTVIIKPPAAPPPAAREEVRVAVAPAPKASPAPSYAPPKASPLSSYKVSYSMPSSSRR